MIIPGKNKPAGTQTPKVKIVKMYHVSPKMKNWKIVNYSWYVPNFLSMKSTLNRETITCFSVSRKSAAIGLYKPAGQSHLLGWRSGSYIS